ncbi:hypothetical protein MKY27_01270 [Solibacillus sp. FSL R5-0449]|uniref:hypothetical protein n=1 Tax=Solibacillus sp. FSL R5-0449 TaxID=2921639 RepID=UPI0030D1B2AA
MKLIKNENGITIVLVLLVIIIFSILGITLFSLTNTNAKQNNKIEVDMQAVNIAEMGIIHYRNALIYHLNDELHSKFVQAISDIKANNELNNPSIPKLEINGSNILDRSVGAFNKENYIVRSLLNTQIQATNDYPYTYEISQSDSDIIFQGSKVTVKFKSTSSVNEQKSTVVGDFTIDLVKLINDNLTINTPSIVPGIRSNKPVQSQNIPAPLITHTNYETGGNQDFVNKNIHVSKDYTAHNIKNVIDTHLFIDGNMKVSNNFTHGLSNSILYTGGNLTFHNGTGSISNSTIYVSGNFNAKLINGTVSNSKIFVEGDLVMTNTGQGSGIIASNSRICVVGKIDTSIAKYKHNGTNIFSLATMLAQGKSADDFNEKCATSSNGDATLDTFLKDISTNLNNANYTYQ